MAFHLVEHWEANCGDGWAHRLCEMSEWMLVGMMGSQMVGMLVDHWDGMLVA